MRDVQDHLDQLRAQIVEFERIRDRSTDVKKRELFANLAEHFRILAAEVEKVAGPLKP